MSNNTDINQIDNLNNSTTELKNIRQKNTTYMVMIVILAACCIVAMICVIVFSRNSNDINVTVKNTLQKLSERAFSISLNVQNNLVNKITIGTDLGDFVACLYNAYGVYNAIEGIVTIPISELYTCFKYWEANNDYIDNLFTESNYNDKTCSEFNAENVESACEGELADPNTMRSYKLHTLPAYLAGIKIQDNNYGEIWGKQETYGYNIKYVYQNNGYFSKGDSIKIQKTKNMYTLLELDTTPFDEYKNKFFQFFYNNNSSFTETIQIAGDCSNVNTYFSLNTLYEYYRYFLIVYKIQKDVFNYDSIETPKGYTNEQIRAQIQKEIDETKTERDNDPSDSTKAKQYSAAVRKSQSLAYYLAGGCDFTITYTDANCEEQTTDITATYTQQDGTISFTGCVNVLSLYARENNTTTMD